MFRSERTHLEQSKIWKNLVGSAFYLGEAWNGERVGRFKGSIGFRVFLSDSSINLQL